MPSPQHKHQLTKLSLFIACFISTSSFAGDAGMSEWFNSMGGYGNVTQGGAFKGQTMNVYTGGGAFYRTPTKSYQLATFDPPRMSAGCGGIDLYSGSFGFMNGEQIVQSLQGITNAAPGYLFSLALENVAPHIASQMKFWRDQLTKLNQLNINSCELATGAVDATVGKMFEKQNGNDAKLAAKFTGMVDDFSGAWSKFQSNNQSQKDAIDNARNNAATPQSEKDDLAPGNIIWRALSDIKRNGQPIPQEDKELIMSLVGTVIIVSGANASQQASVIRQGALINIEQLIDGIDGSAIDALKYQCDTNDRNACVTLNSGNLNTVTWPSGGDNKTFKKRVQTAIEDIMSKMGGRSTQDLAQMGLINSSSLPVWKMLSAYSQIPDGGYMVSDYVSMIATDIAYQYYMEGMKAAEQAINMAKKTNNAAVEKALSELTADTRDKQQRAIAIVRKKYMQATANNSLQQQVMLVENTLRRQISSTTSQPNMMR